MTDKTNTCSDCKKIGEIEGKELYFCPQNGHPTLLLVDSPLAGDYQSGPRIYKSSEALGDEDLMIKVSLVRVTNHIPTEIC